MSEFPGLAEGSLDAFLGFLYDGLTGYVIVAELHTNESNKTWMEHSAYNWPAERTEIKAHINLRGKDNEVYLAPAIFSAPSATKDAFKASNVAWSEYDAGTEGVEEAVSGAGLSSPTLRIQSSVGKEHHYYRLGAPETSRDDLELANRAITYRTGADKGGWDCTQLLRPIGTYNHKYETPQLVRPLEVVNTNGYHCSTLSDGFTPDPVEDIEVVLPKVLPEVADILLKYPFNDEAASLFKHKELPPGKKSDGLMALGFYLAEMGMFPAEMFVLLMHKDKQWGKFSNRADKVQRYLDIVKVAKAKYPKAKVGDEGGENGLETPPPGSDLLVLGWKSMLDYHAEYDWIIEDMFMQDTMNILAGKAGLGKTQLSLRYGMNLALGREEFLGTAIPKQRRVLFLSLELGLVGLKFFQDLMSSTLTDKERDCLEEEFISVPVGYPLDLTTPFGQDALNNLIEQVKPTVVMLDSMGSAVPGGLSKEEPVAELLRYNDRLNSKGISTWYISHPRKTESGGSQARRPTLDDLFGGAFQGNRARGVYALHAGKDDVLELLTLKQSFAKKDTTVRIISRSSDLDFSLVKKEDVSTTSSTKKDKSNGTTFGMGTI